MTIKIKFLDPLNDTGTRNLFTGYAYDELSRPIKVTNAKGQTTTMTKNVLGKVISVSDANGNLITTTDAATTAKSPAAKLA